MRRLLVFATAGLFLLSGFAALVYQVLWVSVRAEDGHHCLRHSATDYDLIISDLFTPWKAGTGNLYTLEHYVLRMNNRDDLARVQLRRFLALTPFDEPPPDPERPGTRSRWEEGR